MEWVFNSADKANAFILAREGYDVWMGNNRGCKYSAYHKTLTTKDREYKNLLIGTKKELLSIRNQARDRISGTEH